MSFESPFYHQDVADLEVLQKRMAEINTIIRMAPEDKDLRIEFLHTLYALVEKEQCLLVRLQLDDTPEAREVIHGLYTEAIESGMPPHHNLSSYHYELKNNIKEELKSMGEDLDSEADID